MNRSIVCLLSLLVLLQGAQGASTNTLATNRTAVAVAKKSNGTVKQLPFSGHIASIDKATKTLTLTGEKKRQVHLVPETKITKAGKTATIEDAVVGEEVGGYAKELDGKLEPLSIRFGPKIVPEKPATTAKPAQK